MKTESVNPKTKGISDATIEQALYMINDEDATVATAVRKVIPNIANFLFLYFLIIKGNPLFSVILTLLFVLLTGVRICLKASIVVLNVILSVPHFFISHIGISLCIQIFINRSVKGPSAQTHTYPDI